MHCRKQSLMITHAFLIVLFAAAAFGQTPDNAAKSAQAAAIFTEATNLFDVGTAKSLQAAIPKLEESRRLLQETGETQHEAYCVGWLGRVYTALGDAQTALDFYNQSLRLIKEIGDKSLEAQTLGSIGVVYEYSGENQKALNYYNQALLLVREVKDKFGEARILSNTGDLYLESRENQKALGFYNQVLLLRKEIGDKRGEIPTLLGIGTAYLALGDKQKALDYYNQSLLLSRIFEDKRGEASTLNNIMVIWISLGNKKFAAFYGKQTVNVYQQLRSNITGLDKSVQQTFLKSIESTYRNLAETLIADNRLPEAQQVLDSFKDQQFFDFNRDPNESIKQLIQTARENELAVLYRQSSEQISKIGSQVDGLKENIGSRPPTADETARLQKLEGELKTASDDFLAAVRQAAKDFTKPADEKDKIGAISDTVDMQTALRQLSQSTGQRTVAVYQLVGWDNFRAIIITPDSIKSVSTPLKNDALNEKAKHFWALLQSPDYDPTKLGKELYDTVFKPIEKELPADTKTIMWSLDGNLRYVPMAALFDGKQYLVERYNHVNFTRANKERMTRAVSQTWTGTGFGSTKAQTVSLFGETISFNALPGVTQELKEIFKQENAKPQITSGIISGDVLPDEKFTKAAMLGELKQRRPLVHIASHFNFRPGDESRSFLLMGDGTAFTLEEMKKQTDLFSGVELLTLSACNTAANQTDANGREVDAFAELAQRLGAGAVMATLWSVADNSTPWLMRDFYANRESGNETNKAEALRQAQIELLNGTAKTKPLAFAEKGAADLTKVKVEIVPINSQTKRDGTRSGVVYLSGNQAPAYKKDETKPFAHPYYWSPFVLIGNWR